MELREFISSTIKEIVDGVVEARQIIKEHGATIPGTDKTKGGFNDVSYETHKNRIEIVEFETILTDTDVSGKTGKIGVSFGSFGAGYENKKGGESTSCTRVKFYIPIVYPPSR